MPISFLAPVEPGELTLSFQLGISSRGEIVYFGEILKVRVVVKAKEPVKLIDLEEEKVLDPKEPVKVFDPEEYNRLLEADGSIRGLG